MSNAATTADTNAADPLKTAADAMAVAVQAAKDGAMDAQSRATEMMPAVADFLSRLTYTTCYAVSYGVVFPTMLVVRAVPKENALVHGLVDGGLAARGAVESMRPGADGGDPGGPAGDAGDGPDLTGPEAGRPEDEAASDVDPHEGGEE